MQLARRHTEVNKNNVSIERNTAVIRWSDKKNTEC